MVTTSEGAKSLAIPSKNVFVPNRLGNLKVSYSGRDFFVMAAHSKKKKIERADLSKELRGIHQDTLSKIFRVGYLSLNMAGSHYTLKLNYRQRGGGLILGSAGYWATKAVCYGVAAAGVSASVSKISNANRGLGALAGGVMSYAAPAQTGATNIVSAALGGANLGDGAAFLTIGAVTSAGGVGGAIAAVETGATAVGLFLTALPTP